MPADIVVPPLGESILEATIGSWLKQAGERVEMGEPVLELETDKVSLEVVAPVSGRLEVLAKAGDSVKPGDVLGSIAAVDQADNTVAEKTAALEPPDETHNMEHEERATPSVRRLAVEQGIDLGKVNPSGPHGRIRRDDLERYVASREDVSTSVVRVADEPRVEDSKGSRPVERVRMSRRRLTIARRLVETQKTAAVLTTFNEADMTAILDLRRRRGESFEKRRGVRLGFMSIFTRAVVAALKQFPRLNAEMAGEELLLKRYYDIGIAVATEAGLVVPVLRDADRLTLAEMEREIARLAGKARSNSLELKDLEGGTFTITNGGVFGSLLSTPILNGTQVGILGMHQIQERPVVRSGQVVARPMMYLALSYDHRIVDGDEAVRFLVTIKDLVEDPELLLWEG